MAVKASANITLTSVVDIQATYRYYLLQSSTLSKPSKPTTNPPSSSWDDTEPTYTSGSTNSLYYVDLTVFSNGTFSYSEVSLSTAYEAAKEAYNKAQNAQNSADQAQSDIDNLEIGGRNLLTGTQNDEWQEIPADGTAVLYYVRPYTELAALGVTAGDMLCYSVGLKTDVAMKLRMILTSDISDHRVVDVKGEYFSGEGRALVSAAVPATAQYVRMYISSEGTGVVDAFWKGEKLEKGNKPTDWTPAPEDMVTNDELTTNYYTKVDTDAKLDITKESITSTVSATYATKSALTTVDAKIDNLEIGGRNLLEKTNQGANKWNWSTQTGGKTIEAVEEDGVKCVRMTRDNTTQSGWSYISFSESSLGNFRQKLEEGVEYTLSVEIKPGADAAFACMGIWSGDSATRLTNTSGTQTVQLYTDKWNQCVWLLKAVDDFAALDQTKFQMVYFQPGDSNVGMTYMLRNLKLEKGNKPTDWTPAPEDLEEATATAQDTAETAQDTAETAQQSADSVGEKVFTVESVVTQLAESISSLVRGQNGESLMTQTDDGWMFSIASIQNELSSAITSIGELNSDMSDTNTLVNSLNQTVADLGVYTDYIEFGVENDQPCIILGETDSPFKVVITNTDIRFMEGSAIPAYINNQSLYVEKAVISDELKQGGFVWMARENGNYGLLWRGE